MPRPFPTLMLTGTAQVLLDLAPPWIAQRVANVGHNRPPEEKYEVLIPASKPALWTCLASPPTPDRRPEIFIDFKIRLKPGVSFHTFPFVLCAKINNMSLELRQDSQVTSGQTLSRQQQTTFQ
ncbi:hypothetical protein V8E52_009288 [Russula decolorans]